MDKVTRKGAIRFALIALTPIWILLAVGLCCKPEPRPIDPSSVARQQHHDALEQLKTQVASLGDITLDPRHLTYEELNRLLGSGSGHTIEAGNTGGAAIRGQISGIRFSWLKGIVEAIFVGKGFSDTSHPIGLVIKDIRVDGTSDGVFSAYFRGSLSGVHLGDPVTVAASLGRANGHLPQPYAHFSADAFDMESDWFDSYADWDGTWIVIWGRGANVWDFPKQEANGIAVIEAWNTDYGSEYSQQ